PAPPARAPTRSAFAAPVRPVGPAPPPLAGPASCADAPAPRDLCPARSSAPRPVRPPPPRRAPTACACSSSRGPRRPAPPPPRGQAFGPVDRHLLQSDQFFGDQPGHALPQQAVQLRRILPAKRRQHIVPADRDCSVH